MTISFNNLGNLGRLGNQMFQYASLKGIARKRDFEFVIPPKHLFGIQDLNVRSSDTNIYELFKLDEKNKLEITSFSVVQERVFHFDEDLYNNCPENIDLYGYFQTPKYFEHIFDEIKSDFDFPKETKDFCLDFFESNGINDVISLHVRRGDYLKYPHHPVQTIEYYEEALSTLPKDIPVIIFSSDSEWCKNQTLFAPDRFLISDGNSTEIDLCLMSMCSYHIIANSSFSWWGSWLSESKKTIAPKHWFGGDYSHYILDDLYLKEWILL